MQAKNLIEWRKLVLERDNYICQLCGEPARIADHILAKNLDKSLLLDVDNGRALCHSCHAKYGTKVYKINSELESEDDSTKEPQLVEKPVDWDYQLEPQLLCAAGDLRTMASVEGKSIQEYLPGKTLVFTFEEYGRKREIHNFDGAFIRFEENPKEEA